MRYNSKLLYPPPQKKKNYNSFLNTPSYKLYNISNNLPSLIHLFVILHVIAGCNAVHPVIDRLDMRYDAERSLYYIKSLSVFAKRDSV